MRFTLSEVPGKVKRPAAAAGEGVARVIEGSSSDWSTSTIWGAVIALVIPAIPNSLIGRKP